MKAIDQYFPVVIFIMLYEVVLPFESADDILSVTILMKAPEQYLTFKWCLSLLRVFLTLKL